MASKPKTDVATIDPRAQAVALWEGEKETGFEGTSSDDYALPFIKLLQKMSPECDPDSGSYVKGITPGQFINTATGEVSETLEIVPCHYHRAIVEWRDREDGGGFVAQHPVGYEKKFKKNEKGQFVTPDGTYLSDTVYMFSLQVSADGSTQPVVLSFNSTQLKKARNWMTQMASMRAVGKDGQRFTLPMFANVYKITTIPEENEKGSWRGYKIELARPVTDRALADAAKEAREMFKTAADRVKPPIEGGEKKSDDDIPY